MPNQRESESVISKETPGRAYDNFLQIDLSSASKHHCTILHLYSCVSVSKLNYAVLLKYLFRRNVRMTLQKEEEFVAIACTLM